MTVVGIIAVIFVVLLFAGIIVFSYLRAKTKRDARSERFRVAITAMEIKRDQALLKGDNNPEAYIAQRELLQMKQRYVDGKENPV